ncbi:hypothetical protein BSKO_02117 [Bryopsis sp. KO-2023]|nr:hypothetical protein BSKO_02117 [Bryopsis sp. KO-2023]
MEVGDTKPPSDGQGGSQPPGEEEDENALVEPEVSEALLSQMIDMGFPRNRVVRALHYSSADGVDQAISWLTENEDDPEIDEPLLLPPKKKMSPEELKLYLEDAKVKAKVRRDAEEKELEIHREKERLRVGREMMAAKRSDEDNARKRMLEARRAEKLEEKAAREKIRVKLEEDKRARRRKLGLPEEPTEEELKIKREKENKKKLEEEAKAKNNPIRFVRPVGELERLRRRLVDMKKSSDGESFKTSCGILMKYLGNISRAPEEEKFRKIRLGNETFIRKVASVEGAVEFLIGCGFEMDNAKEFLVMKSDRVNLELLNGAGSAINGALTNPFFGEL